MKKRVLSMFLALVLCMGLSVPAFAAETVDILADINGTEFWIDVEDADSLYQEISVKYRFWQSDSAGSTWTKDTRTLDVTARALALPLGVTLTAGPDNVWVVGMFVYSDPDGDGIYEQRLQRVANENRSKDVDVIPLTQAGPFRDSGSAYYSSVFDWRYGHDSLVYSKSKGYRVMTTDYLVDTFGPNTLVEFWSADGKERRYILLTGEKRPGELAYDKLEDRGICVSGFGDLVSAWAEEPVNRAISANLLRYDVEQDHGFDLRGKITRGQFASITIGLYVNMLGESLDVAEENPFEDVPEDHTYYKEIAKAYELGIVTGKTGATFDPDALVTREQAAAMLSRVYTALGGEIPEVEATSFADDASISGYAKNAVAFMNEKGIIGGMGGNTFAPKGDATVEQALKIAVEMLAALAVK